MPSADHHRNIIGGRASPTLFDRPSSGLIDAGAEASAALSMSSREIAELTGKRHDHVVRDIEKMLRDVGEGVPKFGGTYINSQNGQEYRCYNLPKNLTLTLIAGYRADLRLKIIDRWLELEGAGQSNEMPVPRTLAEALRLAADQQDRIVAQEQEIARQQERIVTDAPKVAALARLAEADGSFDLRSAAKDLQVKPVDLRNFLRNQKWIYQVGDRWAAYQTKLNTKLMMHKVVVLHQANGRTKAVTRLRITAKGMTRLGEMLRGGWGA